LPSRWHQYRHYLKWLAR